MEFSADYGVVMSGQYPMYYDSSTISLLTTHVRYFDVRPRHTRTRSYYVLKIWGKRSENLYNVIETQQKPEGRSKVSVVRATRRKNAIKTELTS